jgi:hypothetical protein
MGTRLSKVGSLAKWLLHTGRFHYERGQIIAIWASIESTLDSANASAWRYSDKTISKVVPQSLRWKIELFERIHRDLIPFTDLRGQAVELVKLIKARQDDRHWLVHGVYRPIGKVADGWTLKKGEFRSDGNMVFVERTFTQAEMVELRRDLMSLGVKITRYSLLMAARLRKDAADDKGS